MGKVLKLRKEPPTFWESYRWTWRDAVAADKSLATFARLIGVLLATKFANSKTGKCHPGLETIMASAGGSRSSTLRALAQLEDSGWIKKVVPNAPFRNAEYAFTLPGRVPPDEPEQVPPREQTGLNPAVPPTPPYMEQRKVHQQDVPSPLTKYERPEITVRLVEPDSPSAARWDEFLVREGYPPLMDIGMKLDGQYVLPTTVPANKFDKLPRAIALRWANWLRSRALT